MHTYFNSMCVAFYAIKITEKVPLKREKAQKNGEYQYANYNSISQQISSFRVISIFSKAITLSNYKCARRTYERHNVHTHTHTCTVWTI